MSFQSGLEGGRGIRLGECWRQTVSSRQASVRAWDLSANVFVFMQGVTEIWVSDVDCNCLVGVQGWRRSDR